MPVSETSNKRLAALWESGVSLDSAWIEFAKFFDRFSYRALRTQPANDLDVLAHDPRYSQLQSWLPKTWGGRKEMLLVTSRNERYHLLGELYAGDLWAIGFRTLPSGSDQLVRVPRRHFFFVEGVGPDVHIDWDKGELTVGTTTYFDIHVTRASASSDSKQSKPRRSKLRTSKLSNRKKHKKVGGRPPTKPAIIRAFRKLWKTKAKFRTMRVKTMVGEVRAAILGKNARHEERSGYRFSSMAKTIGRELRKARNRKIRSKPKKPKTT